MALARDIDGKGYDSLTVWGNKWSRYSQGQGGPIAVIMEFLGKNFIEAMELLLEENGFTLLDWLSFCFPCFALKTQKQRSVFSFRWPLSLWLCAFSRTRCLDYTVATGFSFWETDTQPYRRQSRLLPRAGIGSAFLQGQAL